MNLIENGIAKKLIKFDEEQKKITYIHQGKTRTYTNPEEQVQADTFLKLVLIYGYPVNRVKQYISVTIGSGTKEADIIVYKDDNCDSAHIVVECKKQEVSELEFNQATEQAFSYAATGTVRAKYFWVTSGIKDAYFEIPDKEPKKYTSIPDIPQFGVSKLSKYKYVKGGVTTNSSEHLQTAGKQRYFDLETVNEDELTRRFKMAHQSLWGGGELNPSEAFDELDKLIFCKIWDEKTPRRDGEPYQFQIFKENDELQTTNELYQRILNLYQEGKRRDPEVFKDNIRLNANKVRTVVTYLESVNLSKTDLDSKGRAFESFMGSYFRGDFGQFFTPRNIVKFIVDVLPIDNTSRVLDTACGSGGFLLYALDKIRNQANDYYDDNSIEHYSYWHSFAERNLFGIEINEQIARTSKMNMIIHDDGHTNVIASDGLLLSEAIIKKTGNQEFKYNSFDYIITNPPFGSTVKQTEKAYLHQYNFGNKDISWLDTKNSAVKGRENQSTEVLFIEQNYYFLKPGGFLAIVIPDGVLTNSSLQYVRDKIEEWYRIVAVVSMPQTAFAHTGAGVKSSVLFLRKWNKATTESIIKRKDELKEKIKADADYLKRVADIEKEKKKVIKEHNGFENNTDKISKEEIEDTQEYKDWKKEITNQYNQQINDLKEELADQYIFKKQAILDDYQIFMAIAEDIGYDATGKPTGNNELDLIGIELKRFISHIIKEEQV